MNHTIQDTNNINTQCKCRSSTIHDLCIDVWEQIFEYFDVMDLFNTFAFITDTVNQALYNDKYRFLFRGLTIDTNLKEIPKQIPLNRIMSLTLYENASNYTLKYCLELRSLKLIGNIEWIIWTIKDMLQRHSKLSHLIIITPTIKSLSELLTPILLICSVRRLEIRTEQVKETAQVDILPTLISNIEQFTIESSCTIDWNGLLHISPNLVHILYLSIGLIDRYQNFPPSLSLHHLRTLVVKLLEVPFDRIINLVATMPCLTKLKIIGLVDADGFVVNQRWILLFEAAPALERIFVRLSLEKTDVSYYCEEIQTPLCALNLNLACDADEIDFFRFNENINRWWSLSGTITKPKS